MSSLSELQNYASMFEEGGRLEENEMQTEWNPEKSLWMIEISLI